MLELAKNIDKLLLFYDVAVLSMLPKLKETLLEMLDSEKLIAELKSR